MTDRKISYVEDFLQFYSVFWKWPILDERTIAIFKEKWPRQTQFLLKYSNYEIEFDINDSYSIHLQLVEK